jgi:hypothetical protein
MSSPRLAVPLVFGVAFVLALVAALLLAPGRVRAQAPAPAPSIDVDPAALREALAALARSEPRVEDVIAAALATADAAPSRARDAAERARLSGLLPSVRVGARRGQGWDLSQLQTTDSGRVALATGDELAVTGEVSFDLGRLLSAREEVALLREERALRMAREELVRAVVSLVYERRRLLLERAFVAHVDLAREVRIDEISALLDVFTEGAFGRMIADRRGGRHRWRSSGDSRGIGSR